MRHSRVTAFAVSLSAFLLSAGLGTAVGAEHAASNAPGCTVGYAMGNAVADGRAIIWRNYDWNNPPHLSQLLPCTHNKWLARWGPYKWVGLSQESWFVFGGINERGVGCFNSLIEEFSDEGKYDYGNYRIQAWILANCASVAEVRKAIREQVDFNRKLSTGVDHGWNWRTHSPAMTLVVIDAEGNTSLFEIAKTFYYEYDPQNPRRLAQFAVQVGIRANRCHRRTDQRDNADKDFKRTGGRRYLEARDNMSRLAVGSGGLTMDVMMRNVARWGDPGFDGLRDGEYRNCNYKTQDGTIIWGAAAGEDPRTATLFVALGNPDYSCYVPVWASNYDSLSERLTQYDSQGIAFYAKRLYDRKVDKEYDDYVNSLFQNMEGNFREAVTTVRKHWNADRFDAKMADAISDEAAQTVYQALKSMDQGKAKELNRPPKLTEITAKIDGKTVTLGRTAQDDGALRETSWDFGDGKTATGKSTQHTYAEAGIYLVRCRVQDNGGSRNSKWKLIRIPAN